MNNFFKKLFNRPAEASPASKVITFTNDPASPQHWYNNPLLKEKFTEPTYPDDLQVIVHDGGRRKTERRPELVWVRTTGQYERYLIGIVLNQPHQLMTVKQGSEILFTILNGAEFPTLVTPAYIAEKDDWEVVPCDNCGFHDLFDAPDELIRLTFPDLPADAMLGSFTTFCGVCGGIQVVKNRHLPE